MLASWQSLLAALAAVLALVAGPPTLAVVLHADGADAPEFAPPVILDCHRAGGEPVLAALPGGVLVAAAHPGFTHFRIQEPEAPAGVDACEVEPGAAKLATAANAETYVWRSADGGATWQQVSIPHALAAAAGAPLPNLPNTGPRGPGVAVSDPDLAYDSTTGRLWLIEIPAPAGAGPSLSWSDDGGLTFLTGRPHAHLGVDRPWLAANAGEVLLTSLTSRWVYATVDGITIEERGLRPGACDGDPLVNPKTGDLLIPCHLKLAVSEDGGASFLPDLRPLPLTPRNPAGFKSELAIDGAGQVWIAGARAGAPLAFAVSSDAGESWNVTEVDVGDHFPDLVGGQIEWFRTAAGSAGRVAAVFLGAAPTSNPDDLEYRVYALTRIDGVLHGAVLTPDPVYRGRICANLNCVTMQVNDGFEPGNDRRMGELFEVAVDEEGRLHVVFTDTLTHADDWVGHVGYVRQIGGPDLLADDEDFPEGFPTQG